MTNLELEKSQNLLELTRTYIISFLNSEVLQQIRKSIKHREEVQIGKEV